MKSKLAALTVWFVLSAARVIQSQEPITEFPAYGEDPQVKDCTLAAIKELDVHAREAGLLETFSVKLGDRIEQGEVLGQIDDDQPQMQREVAAISMEAAKKAALADIDKRYAQKAQAVAAKEYELLKLANQIQDRAVAAVELERTKLDAERAVLAVEKAIHDREMAEYDFYTKKAEHKAAEMAIKRRIIQSPAKGEIVELFREQGEWVNPGDPIVRLVQLDTLNVDGKLDIESCDPNQVLGCKVTVEAVVGGGRKAKAEGHIVWVSPLVSWFGGNTFVRDVRAEIPNSVENGDWRMHPGAEAMMTIHLGTSKLRVSRRD